MAVKIKREPESKPGVWFNTRSGERDLLRTARRGAIVCEPWTVTHMHPLLGGPMVGSMPLETVLHRYGPLYAEPVTEYAGGPVQLIGGNTN